MKKADEKNRQKEVLEAINLIKEALGDNKEAKKALDFLRKDRVRLSQRVNYWKTAREKLLKEVRQYVSITKMRSSLKKYEYPELTDDARRLIGTDLDKRRSGGKDDDYKPLGRYVDYARANSAQIGDV